MKISTLQGAAFLASMLALSFAAYSVKKSRDLSKQAEAVIAGNPTIF